MFTWAIATVRAAVEKALVRCVVMLHMKANYQDPDGLPAFHSLALGHLALSIDFLASCEYGRSGLQCKLTIDNLRMLLEAAKISRCLWCDGVECGAFKQRRSIMRKLTIEQKIFINYRYKLIRSYIFHQARCAIVAFKETRCAGVREREHIN